MNYLYFRSAENKIGITPEPGQKIEGWLKVGDETSVDLKISLGISLTYPEALAGAPKTAQLPLKLVESPENGWQRFQSDDLAMVSRRFAELNKWNAEGVTLTDWLLYITGPDLQSKRIVVYGKGIFFR